MDGLLDAIGRRVIMCDGAMGTQLMARGMQSGECGMLWNVSRPADVMAVHRAYREAGCEMITTNSFGGTTMALGRHGEQARGYELNLAAAKLAREVLGGSGWVIGDVGPFGDFLDPYGETTEDELRPVFEAQIAALSDGGVDALLVETMVDPAEVLVAMQAAAAVAPQLPVIVTFAFQKSASGSFHTLMGTTPTEAVRRCLNAGASMVGANCGTALSLDDYERLAGELVAAAGACPVLVQPNAGSPRVHDEGIFYDASPADMADIARRLAGLGVRVIGGCCGTTPAHLAAMAQNFTPPQ